MKESSDVDFVPVSVDATIADDTNPGVYLVTVTLTRAGRYALAIELRGLQTPTSLTEVVCVPTLNTVALTSNFTGVASEPYTTGQSVVLTIWARDIFTNLRTASTSDIFQLAVLGLYTGKDYGTHNAQSLGAGLYTVSF